MSVSLIPPLLTSVNVCTSCASSLSTVVRPCTHFIAFRLAGWHCPPLQLAVEHELLGITQFLLPSLECLTGTVGTLLLENPLGQNGLTHQGLVYEAAKVFGLRSRRLKLFLNETQTQGEVAATSGRRLVPATVFDLRKRSFECLSRSVCFCSFLRN